MSDALRSDISGGGNSIIPDQSGPHIVGVQPSISSSESRARFEVVDQKLQQVTDTVKRDNLAVWIKQFGTVLGGLLALQVTATDAYFQWFGKHYDIPELVFVIIVSLLSGSAVDLLIQFLSKKKVS